MTWSLTLTLTSSDPAEVSLRIRSLRRGWLLAACEELTGRDQSGGMKLSKSSIQRIGSAFDGVELGDPRRRRRLMRTLKKLATHPQATLPEAMGSEAALEGAYRLLNSEHVSFDALNEAHAGATAARARAVGKVLAIHDTTTCEFAHADAEQVGYLSTGKAGFMAHYSLIVHADGSRRPLGVTHLEPIFRTHRPARAKAKGWRSRKRSGSQTVRDENRESTRWYRGFEKTRAFLEGCEVIHVADREGDNYELFARALQSGQRFVIRARVLERWVEAEDGARCKLAEAVQNCEGVLTREVPLSARKAGATPRWSKSHPRRSERLAQLKFSATRVVLARPRYHDARLPASIQLNVVHVVEPNPPPGEPPVEWVLYTTEPVASAADVEAVVDVYRTRWLIEECNKALKTGCRYEQRQFESRNALLTLLAMTLPIACELLWLRASARARPDRQANEVLTPVQIEILSVLGSRKLPPAPTVRDALWAVAALGGHIKNNGEPGWLVLHRGMVKLTAYEEAWTAARSLPKRAGLVISR